jgi:cytochrome P450
VAGPVFIADLEVVNEVLRDRPQGFRRWKEFEAVLDELGFGGVFSPEGDVWKGQLRLVVTALNSNKLKRYFHILRTANERLCRKLAKRARGEEALDIDAELMHYTVDVSEAMA